MSRDSYAPATAGLGAETPTIERSIMWKIYFVIITLLNVVGIATLYLTPNTGFAELISALMIVAVTIGLYGYVFSTKILNNKVWLGVLVAYVVWTGLYYLVTNLDLTAGMTSTQFWIAQAVSLVLAFPVFLGLFLYARPSYPLWETPAPAE